MDISNRFAGAEPAPRATRPLALPWIAVAAVALSGNPVRALGQEPTPGEVLGRMHALYSNPKSYSGTVRQDQKLAGGTGTLTQRIQFRAPGLHRLTMSYAGPGTWGGLAPGQESVEVYDGKSYFRYWSANRTYKRLPATGKAELVSAGLLDIGWLPGKGATGLSLLPAAQVDGRDAYVVQQAHGNRQGAPLLLYVDRQNFQLLKVQDGPDCTFSYTGQELDAAVPDSAFKFVPPAGTTEEVPQRAVPPTPPPPAVPLRQLLKRGKVTFSARPQGIPIDDKFVLSPDGSFAYLKGGTGVKGTYEIEGNKLTLTLGSGVEVCTLSRDGTVLDQPGAGIIGVYKTYYRD